MTAVWTVASSHQIYLAVMLSTHALVGYVLGAYVCGQPRAGAIGAVLADLDLLFPASWGAPVVHRGITHTALAAGVAVAVAAAHDRSVAGAVGVGYGSQLAIDATTPMGIALLYPITAERIVVPIGGHSPLATVVLWLICFSILWRLELADTD